MASAQNTRSSAGAYASANSSNNSSSSNHASFAQKAALKSSYSSKLTAGDAKSRLTEGSSSPSSAAQRTAPPPPTAWQSGVNPLTKNTTSTPARTSPATTTTSALPREGQKVTITLDSGAEFEGYFAGELNPSTYTLKMVVQKKLPSGADITNGSARAGREQQTMPFQKKDVADMRVTGSLPKPDGRAQNGNSPSFRTDTSISGGRLQRERELQRWVPDGPEVELDGSLEPRRAGQKSAGGAWDQFAENERLFGLTTNYDESFYTTVIDKSHPKYQERMAKADMMAKEIEGSVTQHAHVAEERIKDHLGGEDGVDEEDKYSGVRRQDFPPLGSSNRENKYTPPAKRAPAAHSTVKGAPVDPAIISSQLARPNRGSAESSKPPTPIPKPQPKPADEPKPEISTPTASADVTAAPTPEAKPAAKLETDAKTETKAAAKTESKPAPGSGTATIRTSSPSTKTDTLPKGAPNATATVERDVSNAFKSFATQQRQNLLQIRTQKAKVDKEVKLNDLKKFADSFKLNTPVPKDLISIIAKDPAKQQEIQEKARRQAEAALAVKKEEAEKKAAAATTTASAPATAEQKSAQPSTTTSQGPSPSGSARPNNGRPTSQAPQGPFNQPYRQDRTMPQNAGRGAPHNLGQRLRNMEQSKPGQAPTSQFVPGPDGRQPPTGPAHAGDFSRRSSGVGTNLKLNPNSNEFRPSAFAQPFNPANNRSSGSSPRSSVTPAAPSVPTVSPIPTPSGSLLRRKPAAAADTESSKKEINIIAHVKTIKPPSEKRWVDNGSFRPAYDTPPTWRQLQDDEAEKDSTMNQTYKQHFELAPYANQTGPSHHPPHMNSQAHQHQLPFHLQQGPHMGQRHSPRQPPLHLNGNHHGHGPNPSFGGHDDHRMMPSHSAQSYASPRLQQVNMAYPSPMAQNAQLAYGQMQYPMGPGQQMAQYRSYSGGHQFMPQQGPMGGPVMIQGPPGAFMGAPQGMVPGGPQMPFIPGAQGHFVPPGAAPPPVMHGANGYPSPGRAAPMMVSQGSQQGQPMYGMSPAPNYGTPMFAQQPGQMPNMRGYPPQNQPFGASPQQMHQYPQPHRGGPPGNFNKNFQSHGQQQPQNQQPTPAAPPRTGESSEEAK